jgi:hypothetical protein
VLGKKQVILSAQLVFLSILFLVACSSGEDKEDLPDQLNFPLPPYLGFIVPAPDAEYSLDSYYEGKHYPSISEAHPAPQEGRGRICGEFLSKSLLEPGDYFETSSKRGDFLPDRITLKINANEIVRDDEVIMILSETELKDETGHIVARAPTSHLICWPDTLGKGLHIATIEIKKTSGEVLNYSWSFTLK